MVWVCCSAEQTNKQIGFVCFFYLSLNLNHDISVYYGTVALLYFFRALYTNLPSITRSVVRLGTFKQAAKWNTEMEYFMSDGIKSFVIKYFLTKMDFSVNLNTSYLES